MVSVLFARRDSVYKSLPGCDVWDADRNALTWPGGSSVVCHPPCRAWSRLRGLARIEPGEKACGPWAVDQVRKFGGVLEHPASSALWAACGLPRLGCFDSYGGWTMALPQFWFGHRANKSTWLYILGVQPGCEPAVPLVLGEAPCVVSSSIRDGSARPELSKADRERTPRLFAEWLVELANRARRDSVW